jgi:hypothetical protein
VLRLEVTMRMSVRTWLIALLAAGAALPALAQGSQPADDSTPAFLQIFREEVKPGKGGSHEANETAWAAAYASNKMQNGWLGVVSITGANEAWFFTGIASWEEWEKNIKAEDANTALSAEVKKLSAQDGELLNRVTGIIARFRPNLSYQPKVNLAEMRYLRVGMSRVKPGHGSEYVDSWKQVIDAHEKAKMDEHWAIYQVVSGMPDGTYLYLQAFKSLADIDKNAPMHEADTYKNAVGEEGRFRQQETNQAALEWSQDLVFAFNPKMSYVPKSWADADPAFWTPKAAAPAKKPGEKK